MKIPRARLRALSPLLAAGLVAAAAAGCSSSSSPSASSGAGHYGGTLTMVWNGAGSSIDPAIDYDSNWYILPITNDGLLNWARVSGPRGNQLVPDLATSIPKPTNGGKTYVFQLRRGIRYSTGRPVKASDVTYTLEREFKANGPGSTFYEGLVGGAHCAKSPKTCDLSKGVVADNATGTVTFHLTQPNPVFLQLLAQPFAYLVPPGLPDHDIGTHPVPATGPYMIKSYNPNTEMVLVRNPYFRQWSALAQPKGYPDKIVMKIGLSLEAEVTAVERGQADWMYDTPPADRLNELSTKYPNQVHLGPEPEVEYMALGTRTAPFNNLKARQAVNYAVDRNALIKIAGGPTLNTPTCQVLPSGFPSYKPYCPYTSNPAPGGNGPWKGPDMAKARALMAQSGTKGDTVRVVVTTSSTDKAIGLYFVGLLNQLGYKAHMVALSPSIETNYVQSPKNNVQMTTSYWYADYPDPSDWFNVVVGCAGWRPNTDTSVNLGAFCNQAIQRQTVRALSLEPGNPKAAAALWTTVDRMTTDQAAWVSLYEPKWIGFFSKRLGHFEYNDSTTGGFLIDQAWVR